MLNKMKGNRMIRLLKALLGQFRRKPSTLAERVSHVRSDAQKKLTARTQAGLLGAHVGQAGNIYTISKFGVRK